MAETLREQLNRIDHKCLDEGKPFHDLVSLFESVLPKLSSQDKEKIKQLMQKTDDASIIAAAAAGLSLNKTNTHNSSLTEDTEVDILDSVYSFLNDLGDYVSDQDKVEYVMDLFDIDREIAEKYVEDYLILSNEDDFYVDDDYDECLKESMRLHETLMDAVLDRVDGVAYNPRKFYHYVNGWYDDVAHEMDEGEEIDVANAIIRGLKDSIRGDGGDPENPNAKQLYKFVQDSTWLTDDRTGDVPEYIKNFSYEECLHEGMNDSVIADLESIEKFLNQQGYSSYEVYGYDSYPMGTSKIDFKIDGDWKHDHWYFNELIQNWADENGRKIFKIDEEVIEDTGSDWYPAIHSVYVTKDNDSYDMLNSMRGLFGESLNERVNPRVKQYFEPSYSERYSVRAYYDDNYRGLADSFNSDDFDEIRDKAHEYLSDGSCIIVNDYETGKQIRTSPDEYFDNFEGEGIQPYMFESLNEGLLPDDVYDNLVRNAKKTYSVGLYSTGVKEPKPGFHYEINTEHGVYTKVPDDEGFIAHWFLQTLPQDTIKDMERVANNIIHEYNCKEVSLDDYKQIVNESLNEDIDDYNYWKNKEQEAIKLAKYYERIPEDTQKAQGAKEQREWASYCAQQAEQALKNESLTEDIFENDEYVVYTDESFDFSGRHITHSKVASGVETIVSYAFANCHRLQKVTIPNSVKNIQDSAFSGCESLRSINLPNSLEEIGNAVFQRSGFESISIPASVKKIGYNVFRRCGNLRVVEILSPDVTIGDSDGDVFRNCNLKIARVLPGSTAEKYFREFHPFVEIRYIDSTVQNPVDITTDSPGTVSSSGVKPLIAKSTDYAKMKAWHEGTRRENIKACSDAKLLMYKNICTEMGYDEELQKINDELTNRNINESLDEDTVKQNGKWVNKGKEGTHGKFKTKKQADAQRKAMFANGYHEELNEDAFAPAHYDVYSGSNKGIEYYSNIVKVANGVRCIGKYSGFYGNGQIQKVTLPNTVEMIDYDAFKHCTNLRSINLPESIYWIGRNAFRNCESLESIKLPAHLTMLENACFVGCTNLHVVEFPSLNDGITIADDAFIHCPSLKIVRTNQGSKVEEYFRQYYPNDVEIRYMDETKIPTESPKKAVDDIIQETKELVQEIESKFNPSEIGTTQKESFYDFMEDKGFIARGYKRFTKGYPTEENGIDVFQYINVFIDYDDWADGNSQHINSTITYKYDGQYTSNEKVITEDYQDRKDEWGDPYSYDEVERELKSITNDWTDKDGTIRCYWEQEKTYGLQILKQHYNHVETSDGRTGRGEEMSWVIAYSNPKEIEEDFSFEDNASQLKNLMGQNQKLFNQMLDDTEEPRKKKKVNRVRFLSRGGK